MATIDADAHVVETDETWTYLDPADSAYRPVLVSSDSELRHIPKNVSLEEMLRRPSYFLCDDQLLPTARVTSHHYPAGAQFPTNVTARLRHMSELGVDIQVLFPSIFLDSHFRRVEAECALVRAYNRWIADLCAGSGGRLRWVVMICPANVAFSLGQIEEGRRKGACGVFMRGYEDDRMIDDPRFFPIYAKAQDLDMPITVHAGLASPSMKRMVHGQHTNFAPLILPTIAAMAALHKSGIPARFPRLRFGFLEATASWIPFAVYRADAGWDTAAAWQTHRATFLRGNRFFVTVEPHEDIPMLLTYGAEDNLMVASDYGHSDSATTIAAHRVVRERPDCPTPIAQKLNGANAAAFYGI